MTYDELFKAGNKEQLKQMIHYSTKTGYNDIDLKYAYKKIKKNLRCLWKEIYLKPFLLTVSFILPKHYIWFWDVKKITANIANYSHMVIYKCNKEIKL